MITSISTKMTHLITARIQIETSLGERDYSLHFSLIVVQSELDKVE